MSFLSLTQTGGRLLCRAKNANKNFKRNSWKATWSKWWEADAGQQYREQPVIVDKLTFYATIIMTAVFTTYLGYNFYRHPKHVTGEFPKVMPSKWTDEELGIPPDDEDIYPPGYIPLKDRV